MSKHDSNDFTTGYKSFAAYLVTRGWVPAEHADAVVSAAAAFESAQRAVGRDAAKSAMIKAVEKIR
ncbi:hypothetical protein HUE56_30010 (plasmid) [Azospirillum oryzae]|uniref:Uncharacterized protein n=1 Tax=Azospirillum oryzae TaxID=286727 RepID=A0A6N1AX09_9PROT|nr:MULTISPECIES: hypothetical protein [Azospirillum]KAA0584269.1 hypothetical protein FZ938_30250 [Azospirillum oryzae]PWC83338.1 hypothetical protein TSO5_29595 [Azospirillum sp. TSO5]QCG99277.1 hypothetical protein E6C67_36430 [Azospirillum sp. TSA2s]QKS54737.1 hypothetical protein HUE56_30010 [Azospirillum oryzae]GLR83053.1 hypothetical protein GCM10007856_57610 [Azospirillum oryzae]